MSRRNPSRLVANERGATIVVVAICLVFIVSMAALAIDLGMLLTARAETQRAADAAALAGAAEYLETLPSSTNAKARAIAFAGRNTVRGKAGNTEFIDVNVDHGKRQVSVQLRLQHDLWFARIFGLDQSPVGALAVAHVRTSGTAPCIGPFALPHDTYTDTDIGKKVLVWESRSNNEDEGGDGPFILIGNTESSPGVGHDIYRMLTDEDCTFSTVAVGDSVPRKPGNNTLGNPKKGLADLKRDYGPLTWTPEGPYDGFNKPDYEDDPRVILIPMYDKTGLTLPPTGTGKVLVTGFLRVVLMDSLDECQNNGGGNRPPCRFPGNGKKLQLHAVILPAVGLSDTCAGPGCSELNRTLQLIK